MKYSPIVCFIKSISSCHTTLELVCRHNLFTRTSENDWSWRSNQLVKPVCFGGYSRLAADCTVSQHAQQIIWLDLRLTRHVGRPHRLSLADTIFRLGLGCLSPAIRDWIRSCPYLGSSIRCNLALKIQLSKLGQLFTKANSWFAKNVLKIAQRFGKHIKK